MLEHNGLRPFGRDDCLAPPGSPRYDRDVPRYDASTALIVVDVQNDFADPAGSLAVAGGAEVVPYINDQIEAALAAGGHVIYSQDWHPPSTPHFEKDGGIWPVHCVAGTWGAEFHPDLIVKGPVIRKGVEGEDGYSVFSVRHPVSGHKRSTELERMLDDAGVKRVFIVGLATDYCVHATVLEARERDLPITVLAPGVRAVELNEGDGQRALAELQEAGATIESDAS
jgi:nicotinamidase/pyrazinamidase